MRQLAVLISLISLLALSACGGVLPDTFGAEDLPDPAGLTAEWGCGHGFWLGTSDQTAALRVAYTGEGPPPATAELPSPDWDVTLIVGRDLYANWCDDVIEPGEPTPVEHWVLPVTGGRITVLGEAPEPFSGGELGFTAGDLVVELPDGSTAPWGDFSGRNPTWGFFAG